MRINNKITNKFSKKPVTFKNQSNKYLNNFKSNRILNFKNANIAKRFNFRASKDLEKKQEIKKK